MTTRTIVKRKAHDFRAGMTVDEMRSFLWEVHSAAPHSGEDTYLSSPVRCTVNMRGGIKELSVEVTHR